MKFLNPISFIDSSGNEIKLDNNIVFKDGSQTITGSKTFTADLYVDGGSTRAAGINVISGSGSGSRNLRLFNASYDGNTRGLYDSGSGTYIINISHPDNRIGLTVDDANIRSNIEAKTLEVDFINLKDPEGRTNTALPNVCSMNMGDDTTLFDCDAAGKIGLIGRDDPIHPEQNPNHTTGIRFFRSSSNNTVTSDYADFFYDSSNDRFEADKLIIAPKLQCSTAPSASYDVIRKYEWDRAYENKIAQLSSTPGATTTQDAILTYNASRSGNKFGWTWASSFASSGQPLSAQTAAMISVLASLGGSLTKCTNSTETISLGLSDAFICYEYTSYSNGYASLSGGTWDGSPFFLSFPFMVIPYYSGSMAGSRRGFWVISANEFGTGLYLASGSITITLENASNTLFYKKFTLIPS